MGRDAVVRNKMAERIRELRTEVAQARTVLRRLEWVVEQADCDNGFCGICGAADFHGHRDDCALEAVLKGAR